MINLYSETEKILNDNGKDFWDILWVGGDDFQIELRDFLELSNKYYNNGYGRQEVATDLKLVGKDFWLERHEYDGAEWWEYKTLPQIKNLPMVKIHTLFDDCWNTLKECNRKE